MRKYVLVNRKKKFLVRLIDAIGGFIIRKNKLDLPKKANNIAILLLDHIGDFVLSAPIFEIIKKRFPAAKITVFTTSWSKELVEGSSDINSIVEFPAPWFSRPKAETTVSGINELSKKLKEGSFDMAIDFRGDFRHIAAMALARIPYKIGFDITGGGFLLNRTIPFPFNKHIFNKNHELARSLGIESTGLLPAIFPDTQKFKNGSELAFSLKDNKNKLAAIHPGTGAVSKMVPQDIFIKICKGLAIEDTILAITGSKDETELAGNLMKQISDNSVNFAGRLSIGELCGFLSELDLFISGDTGPLHIAAALGVPAIGIFSGTNDSNIWGPVGGKDGMLRIFQSPADCSPCGKSDCSDLKCFSSLNVDDIVTVANQFLRLDSNNKTKEVKVEGI